MHDNFTTYKKEEYKTLIKMDSLPIFTNKTYSTYEDAISCKTGSVNLVQSLISGFIYNLDFEPDQMNYDNTYNNEQGFSNAFLKHLDLVSKIIFKEVSTSSKIIEIGCGKGLFLNKLKKDGFQIKGYDPTYEGDDVNIIKDYFSEKYNTDADFLILRHTLEHIKDPFTFLHLIAKANNYLGKIYIEVPTFDWISDRTAFWDITYEHCNYFTETTLSSMFNESKTGRLFGYQYIYLIADLSSLKQEIQVQEIQEFDMKKFKDKINQYQIKIDKLISIAIWGGAAKGLLFLNQIDPYAKKIEYVIDINPAKHNRFIAKSGHKILLPIILNSHPVINIFVANENYYDEIKESLNHFNINLIKIQ